MNAGAKAKGPAETTARYVALLRGINVGGKNIVPMLELAAMFARAGCSEVRTYIQSGNVVFSAPAATAQGLGGVLSASIAKRFGYRIPVILRSARDMEAVVRGNPFLLAGEDAKLLHVYFLAGQPEVSAVAALDPQRSAPDAYRVQGREIFLHLPNGMARTKLTNAYFDSSLKTTSTARNWATVLKLLN